MMTEIASHRGGAALWPENSEAAFRGTMGLGVEQIEFDVQMSADGVPVIFHDTMLERVTDGSGPLGARTLAELRRLTIAAVNGTPGGRILTLDEGLDILAGSDLILRCEVKPGVDMRPYPGLVAATLQALEERGLLACTVLSSFHLPTLSDAADARLRDRLWLVADPIARLTAPRHLAALARGEEITSLALHHRLLREGALEALRDEGLAPSAFAVLEDEAIEWAIHARLPVFTTDRPDAALRIRNKTPSPSDRPL